jgi:predicted Zn-dependent peptidase
MNIKGGSLVESKTQNGVAHFMEHMLVQGIPVHPTAEKLSEYVEGIAGSYGASTSKLEVSFNITVPISHMENAVKIASQIFFEPLFTENAIEKERIAVISEIRQKQDSRMYKLNQFFLKTRYIKNSILKQSTGGSEKIIQNLKREDLIQYWNKYFLPKNTYIFITGKFNENEALKLLEEHYGKYQKKDDFTGFPKLTTGEFSNRSIYVNSDKELNVNYIDLSFPALKLTDSLNLRLKQLIALVILGRLRSSRLFKLLRYNRGLVYDVGATDSKLPDIGFVDISSEVDETHLDTVVQLITENLTNYINQGPTKEEVDFTKNYLTNNWLMAFDSPDSIADWLESELLLRSEVKLPNDYIEMIKNISAKEITEMMQQHWNLKKLNLLVQGPIKNKEKAILKFTNYLKDL